ncbi:MAG TPA: UDP-N-acetylmuramoyl-L-alanyl-D-glutamate--2,6-diaminopimelate ligase [Actinopolymorphaceae bacterium]
MSATPARPGTISRPLLDVAAFLGVPAPSGAEGVTVTGVAQDSRAVQPGGLYVARPGANAHGAAYAFVAASAGARAAVTDPAGRAPCEAAGLPTLVVPDPAAILGPLASWMYGEPTRDLVLLGVTGTNGKTTTTYFLEAALRQAGHRTGLIGTVETRIEDEVLPSMRTTPEAPDLQALLARMRAREVSAAAMEVSSHALSLGRVAGCHFDVAGFTNLSLDHLELHGDLESYFAAKASLFTPELTALAVIDIDDPYGERLAKDAAARGVEVVTVSPSGDQRAAWRAGPVEYAQAGALGFDVEGPDGIDLRLALGIPGTFNVANALVAAAMLHAVAVDPASIVLAFAAARIPGRMERVTPPEGAGETPTVIVDYAHTPDAVGVVLETVRPWTTGSVIAVVGCGGDRDRSKRPVMGEVAARAADVVVVTDDNPRSEDPAAIRAAVLAGTERVPREERAEVVEVGDRRAAVAAALERATPNDTVLVLGKGHESGQEIRGVVHPFDDREVVTKIWESR